MTTLFAPLLQITFEYLICWHKSFHFAILIYISTGVSGQLPQRKIAPWFGLGFGLGLGLDLGLGARFLGDNCPRTLNRWVHLSPYWFIWQYISSCYVMGFVYWYINRKNRCIRTDFWNNGFLLNILVFPKGNRKILLSLSWRIFWENVTTFTEEILNGKFQFFVQWGLVRRTNSVSMIQLEWS